MICTSCGNNFPDGMSSCPVCGAMISTPVGEVPNYAADPAYSATPATSESSVPAAPTDLYSDAASFMASNGYDAGNANSNANGYDAGGYNAGGYNAGSYDAGGYNAGAQNSYSSNGSYGTTTQSVYNTGYSASNGQGFNRFGSIKEHNDYLFGILSYLSVIGLIIVGCSEPNSQKSDYLLFHFNQSLTILLFSLLSAIPVLGWFWAIFIVVCEIMAVIYAARGEMKSVAFFGNIKLIKR